MMKLPNSFWTLFRIRRPFEVLLSIFLTVTSTHGATGTYTCSGESEVSSLDSIIRKQWDIASIFKRVQESTRKGWDSSFYTLDFQKIPPLVRANYVQASQLQSGFPPQLEKSLKVEGLYAPFGFGIEHLRTVDSQKWNLRTHSGRSHEDGVRVSMGLELLGRGELHVLVRRSVAMTLRRAQGRLQGSFCFRDEEIRRREKGQAFVDDFAGLVEGYALGAGQYGEPLLFGAASSSLSRWNEDGVEALVERLEDWFESPHYFFVNQEQRVFLGVGALALTTYLAGRFFMRRSVLVLVPPHLLDSIFLSGKRGLVVEDEESMIRILEARKNKALESQLHSDPQFFQKAWELEKSLIQQWPPNTI